MQDWDERPGTVIFGISFGYVMGIGLAVLLLSALIWSVKPWQTRQEHEINRNSQQNITSANARLTQLYTEYRRVEREDGPKAPSAPLQPMLLAILSQMRQQVGTLPQGQADITDYDVRQFWLEHKDER